MYLTHIENTQIARFINSLNNRITRPVIRRDDIDGSIIVYAEQVNSTFHITDFECIDIKNSQIHSKLFRKFMIEELDKINLGDNYIDGLHDYLEQDTVYGPIL